MPASEARIIANQANAQRSTGPRTPEGKERSRANSLKHGMTGAGVVLPTPIVAEVNRRATAFAAELAPSGEVGMTILRHAAIFSVRVEACFESETAAVAEHVRKTMAEFQAPEGIGEAEATQLRAEAGQCAMFNPSKEASLARRYQASAERGFYRALKEFRMIERRVKDAEPPVDLETLREDLGSFLKRKGMDPDFEAMLASMDREMPFGPPRMPSMAPIPTPAGPIDVPISIGKRR